MTSFPKPSNFNTDPRVDFVEDVGKWVFTDETDGMEYEYEPGRGWFPLVTETQVEWQQSAYGTSPTDLDNTILESASDKRKRLLQQQQQRKRSISPGESSRVAKGLRTDTSSASGLLRNKPTSNKSIYIQNLPQDVTVDELATVFAKYGIIMEDFTTKEPKIKLYRHDDGKLKGDALITYFKPESVPLAITLMDDAPLRLADNSTRIRVSEAQFNKPSAAGQNGSLGPSIKRPVDPQKKKRAMQQLEKKLVWFETDEAEISDKYRRIVILKHMFVPAELEKDPTLLLDLKEDIRQECEKLGVVTNVKLFDTSPDGVVSVKFADKASATACVELMDGRWFGGRRVCADIYDGKSRYGASQPRETEEETQERLEKFAQWLEQDENSP
ncbi:hypothetical protein IWQ61_000014 [Dispira simplex]|nr:hypothetical protein IWQ61_000014 [Dispira simplex]